MLFEADLEKAASGANSVCEPFVENPAILLVYYLVTEEKEAKIEDGELRLEKGELR